MCLGRQMGLVTERVKLELKLKWEHLSVIIKNTPKQQVLDIQWKQGRGMAKKIFKNLFYVGMLLFLEIKSILMLSVLVITKITI